MCTYHHHQLNVHFLPRSIKGMDGREETQESGGPLQRKLNFRLRTVIINKYLHLFIKISQTLFWFQFLVQDFLGYLRSWKESTETRPGNFTKAMRQQMFLSQQTFEGLYRTGGSQRNIYQMTSSLYERFSIIKFIS